MVLKVSWSNVPKPKKGDVFCTRLRLQAVFSAAKKHAIQRGSERTICSCKCPNRTVKGGARPALLPIPIHAPPGQTYDSYLLTKINDDCCSDTRTPAVIISNEKRMLPITAASSDYLLGSVLVHFQQDLE